MAKKLKIIDKKMQQVLQIVEQASTEIVGWAQDSDGFIEAIKIGVTKLNNDLQEERITQEDAAALYDQDMDGKPSIRKNQNRLTNRIKRMTKNVKAMNGLLAAMKSMQDDDDEKEK